MPILRTLGALQQPMLGFTERALTRFKPAPKPIVPAQGFDKLPPTDAAELDNIVTALHARSAAWCETDPKQRARLLRDCLKTTLEVAEGAAAAATSYKGSFGHGIGEEL